MASLKEVKARIASVSTTQKITSAMKMVSSAKLKKAQRAIESIAPYQDRLYRIMNNFLTTETDFQSDLANVREVQKLAIVVFSSNSSLCGAFNSNVAKQLRAVVEQNKQLGLENIVVYPVGQKIYNEAIKQGFNVAGNFRSLLDKPEFNTMSAKITNVIVDKFLKKEIDKVIVIYHHMKSTASQELVVSDFLPISSNLAADSNNDGKINAEDKNNAFNADYIVEPSKTAVLEALLPKTLRTKLYACLLDSNASEHAARVVAMQTANDNAESLINELTILYNKTRQASITSELLDIVGGAAALEG